MLNIAGNKKVLLHVRGHSHHFYGLRRQYLSGYRERGTPTDMAVVPQGTIEQTQSIFYYICAISQTYMFSIPNTKAQKEEKAAAHCIKCKKLQVSLLQHGLLFCVRYGKCVRLGSGADVVQGRLFALLFPMALRRYPSGNLFHVIAMDAGAQNMMRMGLAGLCSRS